MPTPLLSPKMSGLLLFFCNLIGDKVAVELDPGATVSDLEEEVGVAFTYQGKTFDDPTMLLADTGLGSNATIYEVFSYWKPSDDIKIVKKVIDMMEKSCWILTDVIIDFMMTIHQGHNKVNNFSIENWDMSGMTDMQDMFEGATSFNQPIGRWDMSNVESMDHMFSDAISFNQPIGDWNVSNVDNMTGMFWGASSFNQPIAEWTVYNVKDMSRMFRDPSSFNQDIREWNMSNMVCIIRMFDNTTSFNSAFSPIN